MQHDLFSGISLWNSLGKCILKLDLKSQRREHISPYASCSVHSSRQNNERSSYFTSKLEARTIAQVSGVEFCSLQRGKSAPTIWKIVSACSVEGRSPIPRLKLTGCSLHCEARAWVTPLQYLKVTSGFSFDV